MFLSYRYNRTSARFNGPTNTGGLSAQRNLNNAFAYDLVPSVSVIAAALKAARRVNDYPTAVRIFEGMQCSLTTGLSHKQKPVAYYSSDTRLLIILGRDPPP